MSIPQSGGGPIESFDQLALLLEKGNKPKSDWRIGTEHEKFGYCKDTLAPLPYEGERSVLSILQGLRDQFNWAHCHGQKCQNPRHIRGFSLRQCRYIAPPNSE